ncbi:MAG TPA: hypothetical protein DD000_20515 [Cyanobacteria bacterium UBA11166]|nr:hypothetical protein [Cyanobacteria bacterium UBA11166]
MDLSPRLVFGLTEQLPLQYRKIQCKLEILKWQMNYKNQPFFFNNNPAPQLREGAIDTSTVVKEG